MPTEYVDKNGMKPKWKQNGLQKAKQDRIDRAKRGVCTHCEAPNAAPYRMCESCRENQRQIYRARRISEGHEPREFDEDRSAPYYAKKHPVPNRKWTKEEKAELAGMLDKVVPIDDLLKHFDCTEKELIRCARFMGRDDFNPRNFASEYVFERIRRA